MRKMLADPDPLMRLANMKAIVSSGDVLKLQAAPCTAFTGERVTTMLMLHNPGRCDVDFPPTRRQPFEGSLACGGWPKLAITAPVL
jgi:hypothetical protein